MDSSEYSENSSNLSLKLKYPIFKLKFPCDGVPWTTKKKGKLPIEESIDGGSVCSREIPWLFKNRNFCKILFDEKLIVCRTLDKMIGEAVINVYLTQEYDFLLHCDWKLFDTDWSDECVQVFDNISLTSLIRRNLTTMEEKYCEVDRKNNKENHVYVYEKFDSYFVSKRMMGSREMVQEKSYEYCVHDSKNMTKAYKDILTQGSLILFLRQLTILNVQEIEPMHLVSTDGKLFDVFFELSDFHCVLFDNKFVILVKNIVAKIIDPESSELSEQITTFLSENGKIVYQEWKSKQVVLRFDPRKDIESEYCGRSPVAKLTSKLPLDKVWWQDMQLNSLFTQQRKTFETEYESFYDRHPELRSILRDYMKDILMFKPEDPLSYTIDYFNEFLF